MGRKEVAVGFCWGTKGPKMEISLVFQAIKLD